MSKFSASGGEYIRSIDPLNTFELKFRFHPNSNDLVKEEKDQKSEGLLSKIGDNLVSAGKDALNNATGGLTGNLFSKDIIDERLNFDSIH